MQGKVNPIPEGFGTASIHMTIRNAAEAIEFYRKAFGAEEIVRMPGPDENSVMHSELRIGDSVLMVNDEFPGHIIKAPSTLQGTTFCIHLYVEDADAFFDRAVKTGATVVMPVTDQFWGDRFGQLSDPYGHVWSVATHVEDVSPEECGRRAKEMFSKMKEGGCR